MVAESDLKSILTKFIIWWINYINHH